MKNFFNKLVAVLFMALATVGYSCSECDHEPYDDSEIREQIQDLYTKLAALEAKVNANMTTLQGMISGLTTVKSHKQDANGNWEFELSDGTKFTVYAEYKPEALPSNLIYVMEVDGVKVWATMDANGQLTPMLDADGKAVPVVPVIKDPEITTKVDGDYIYISIDGGANWVKSGIAAIEDVEITTKVEDDYIYISIDGGANWIKTGLNVAAAVAAPELEFKEEDGKIWIKLSNSDTWIETGMTDDALDALLNQGGNNSTAACACGITDSEFIYGEDQYGDQIVTGVIFTLSDGSTFTVEVDSDDEMYFGFWFEGSPNPIETFYVSPGKTENWLEFRQKGLVDFIKEIPADWTLTMTESNGDYSVRLKAPDTPSTGTIKFFGVFEDGTSAVYKMNVTNESPWKTFSVNNTKVQIELYQGAYGFVYGVMEAADYDPATIEGVVNAQLASYQAQTKTSFDGLKLDASIEEIYGGELEENVEYVFYTALMAYDDYKEIVDPNAEFRTKTIAKPVVAFEQTASTFNTITVSAKLAGFDKYYAVFSKKDEFNMEEWLSYSINRYLGWGDDPECTQILGAAYTFTGLVHQLPFVESSYQLNPDTEYIICVIPAEEGKTEYTADDAFLFENFKTAAMVAGGTIKVDTPTIDVDFTSAGATLTAAGARMIYYSFYEAAAVPATEEELVADLLAKNYFAASGDGAYANDLESGVDYVLVVMPVDNSGAYSAPQKFPFKTKSIAFSQTFTLTATPQAIADPIAAATGASFKLEAAGGTMKNFRYINKTTSAFNNSYPDDMTLAKKMIVEIDYDRQERSASALNEGCFDISGLTTGTEYTLAIVAFDTEGNYTTIQKIVYTPTFNATVIPATDPRWEASKPTVSFANQALDWGNYYYFDYTVTPTAGTTVSGGFYANSTLNGYDAAGQVVYIFTRSSVLRPINAITAATTIEQARTQIVTNKLYLTWTDAEGNYYEPMECTVPVE